MNGADIILGSVAVIATGVAVKEHMDNSKLKEENQHLNYGVAVYTNALRGFGCDPDILLANAIEADKVAMEQELAAMNRTEEKLEVVEGEIIDTPKSTRSKK